MARTTTDTEQELAHALRDVLAAIEDIKSTERAAYHTDSPFIALELLNCKAAFNARRVIEKWEARR